MNQMLTQKEIQDLTKFIFKTCESIILRCGPFLKEGIYQDILVHELQKNNIQATRELVFPYQFQDSDGHPIYIGNCQSLRSDIELPKFHALLELKASSSLTKEENIFQLRNYLENRYDKTWGLLINFVSKFNQTQTAKVYTTLLMKTSTFNTICIDDSNQNQIVINRYHRQDFESRDYPALSELFIPFTNIPDPDSEGKPEIGNDNGERES